MPCCIVSIASRAKIAVSKTKVHNCFRLYFVYNRKSIDSVPFIVHTACVGNVSIPFPGLCLRQTRRLCHRCIGCIRPDPKDDRIVFAKVRVGHSLWERVGNTLEYRRNQPLIWQARTWAQQLCPTPRFPWRWSWHQLRPWLLVAITLTVAMGRLDNSLHPCPSRTTIG